MNVEEFRTYCLSFAGTHDDFPFGKSSSDYDRDILVFYVLDKWFCFVNAVAWDFCNLRCAPERIPELRERYEGIGPGLAHEQKTLDQRPLRQRRARRAPEGAGPAVV